MKTKFNFTINWSYILLLVALVWAGWVTIALKDAVEAHNTINERLDNHRRHIIDIEIKLDEHLAGRN